MWKSLKSNTSLKLTSRLSFLESKSSMSLISSKFCQYLKSLSDKLKPNPKMFFCPFTPQIRENDYLRQCLSLSYSSIDNSANPVSKSFLLDEFFSFVFPTKSSDFSSLQIDVVYPNLSMDVSTSHTEVRDILCKLEVNKATGVAGQDLEGMRRGTIVPISLIF